MIRLVPKWGQVKWEKPRAKLVPWPLQECVASGWGWALEARAGL